MSGGALEYAGEALAETGKLVSLYAKTPLHRAFATHLDKVSAALHDLEWMLSGDTSEGSEVAAIQACLSKHDILDELVAEAKQVAIDLNEALLDAEALRVVVSVGNTVLERIGHD